MTWPFQPDGPFTCCDCPDGESSYVNLCGCPTVEIECVSSEKDATLCGFSEYSGFESTPPKKYKRSYREATRAKTEYSCVLSCSPNQTISEVQTTITPYIVQYDYDLSDCTVSLTTETDAYRKIDDYSTSFPDCGTLDTTTFFYSDSFPAEGVPISSTEKEFDYELYEYFASAFSCGDEVKTHTTEYSLIELQEEDTEEDALDRAAAVAGTDCTSIYELRTTSFSVIHRTVEYTATASNLAIGQQYHGCIRLQRRESYSGTAPDGADTNWYDVEPDEIESFTATNTEEVIAEDVELPIEQGYEYRIEGAYIYPTDSDCECPSTYEPEE